FEKCLASRSGSPSVRWAACSTRPSESSAPTAPRTSSSPSSTPPSASRSRSSGTVHGPRSSAAKSAATWPSSSASVTTSRGSLMTYRSPPRDSHAHSFSAIRTVPPRRRKAGGNGDTVPTRERSGSDGEGSRLDRLDLADLDLHGDLLPLRSNAIDLDKPRHRIATDRPHV